MGRREDGLVDEHQSTEGVGENRGPPWGGGWDCWVGWEPRGGLGGLAASEPPLPPG